MSGSDERVLLEIDAPLAVVTIHRPEVLNALDIPTLQALEARVAEAAAHPEVRVVILTGAGEKAFIAGADIKGMAGFSVEEARRFGALGHRVLAGLEALDQPVIAAVNGFALGGGCEVSLACDLVVASERARFGQPEVKLGVIPGFGGTQRLARRVGQQRAAYLVYSGEMIDAATAVEWGLALEAVAPEGLLDRARELGRMIAAMGPLAVARAKRMIQAGPNADLATANLMETHAFAMLFDSEDQKEGMQAFLEKREAKFRGR